MAGVAGAVSRACGRIVARCSEVQGLSRTKAGRDGRRIGKPPEAAGRWGWRARRCVETTGWTTCRALRRHSALAQQVEFETRSIAGRN